MSRSLILIRHGQTTYNATKRMQGHLDTELSELGYQQAEAAARLLADKSISAIVSSDLRRASETARVIGEALGLPVATDARLRETDLGDWQGRSAAEVDAEFPGARGLWRHDPTWAPPGGESRIDVAVRCRPVIDELMHTHSAWNAGPVLVVGHAGQISALTCSLLGFAPEQYALLSGLKNTHWSQLTARPRFDAANPTSAMTFTDANVDDATWYFDGWNMGARVVGDAGADV